MRSVRIAYIVCSMLFSLGLLILAILTPVIVTPGYYWWSALCLLLMATQSHAFSRRLNSWGCAGHV